MRGRLIHSCMLELQQIDTSRTEDVDGGGYDPIFTEPRLVADGTQAGATSRRETQRLVRAQVEPGMYNSARTLAGGRVRDARFEALVHYRDLEDAEMLDPDGIPNVRVGDRLAAIWDDNEQLVMRVPDPPGLYVVSTTPRSFAYGGRVNLYELVFTARLEAR